MNRFVFKNTFIHASLFEKYFINNKRSKLYFGDRVVVLNVSFFRTERVKDKSIARSFSYKTRGILVILHFALVSVLDPRIAFILGRRGIGLRAESYSLPPSTNTYYCRRHL
jgi:hypothetical protein